MADFYSTLPKKRMAAAALIRDDAGNILIVKPTYRPDWLLPGGIIEANESPRQACLREVREEVSINASIGSVLCIDYTRPDGEKTESLQFVFDGGVVVPAQRAGIRLPAQEIRAYRFAPIQEALSLLNPKVARRIRYCVAALASHSTVYLEDGMLCVLDDHVTG